MTHTLEILTIISAVELLLWLPGFWRLRRPLAVVVLVALAVMSGVLLASHFRVWQWIFLLLSGYRVVNLLRVIEARSQPDYLKRSGRHVSLWLIGLQLLICLVAALLRALSARAVVIYAWLVLALSFAVMIVLVKALRRHLCTTQPPELTENIASRDLPSLTVAIPARNETTALEACLRSLLQSTYPKLEILVLDDCSQTKRTPEIIRGFAHDGVEFIPGGVPPEHWLAKNYAYHQLAEAANGDLVLFCGVDVRFSPDSLNAIVATMLQKKKTMLSIMPKNQLRKRFSLKPFIVKPTRYAWELALPRRWLERPPVLSTCWIIERKTLQAAGGFAAVTRSSLPESYLSRYAASHRDGYSFLCASESFGLTSSKPFGEQEATAIRMRYPQLHRRPDLVAMLTLVELAVLVAPFVILVGSLIAGNWLLAIFAVIDLAGLTYMYTTISCLTYRRFLVRSLLTLLPAALYDIGLLNYSMWQYEFGEVIWKGRNVCVPVMRSIPTLPKLEEVTVSSARKS